MAYRRRTTSGARRSTTRRSSSFSSRRPTRARGRARSGGAREVRIVVETVPATAVTRPELSGLVENARKKRQF